MVEHHLESWNLILLGKLAFGHPPKLSEVGQAGQSLTNFQDDDDTYVTFECHKSHLALGDITFLYILTTYVYKRYLLDIRWCFRRGEVLVEVDWREAGSHPQASLDDVFHVFHPSTNGKIMEIHL